MVPFDDMTSGEIHAVCVGFHVASVSLGSLFHPTYMVCVMNSTLCFYLLQDCNIVWTSIYTIKYCIAYDEGTYDSCLLKKKSVAVVAAIFSFIEAHDARVTFYIPSHRFYQAPPRGIGHTGIGRGTRINNPKKRFFNIMPLMSSLFLKLSLKSLYFLNHHQILKFNQKYSHLH